MTNFDEVKTELRKQITNLMKYANELEKQINDLQLEQESVDDAISNLQEAIDTLPTEHSLFVEVKEGLESIKQ